MSIIRVKTIPYQCKLSNGHCRQIIPWRQLAWCFLWFIICKEAPKQWLKFYHCFVISFPLWLFASMPLKDTNAGIFHHERLTKLHPHSVDVQHVQSKFATNTWPSKVNPTKIYPSPGTFNKSSKNFPQVSQTEALASYSDVHHLQGLEIHRWLVLSWIIPPGKDRWLAG